MTQMKETGRDSAGPRGGAGGPGPGVVPAPRDAAAAAAREAADPRIKRWTRLLTKAEKDPFSVLRDQRCLRPHFVERFFDLCDAKALSAPWAAEDFAKAASELVLKTRDPHQALRAVGICAHVLIGLRAWEQADRVLEEFREEAFACCDSCASDWLRRKGDLLVESRDPEGAQEYLARALEVLGDDPGDQAHAHILFVRGIAFFALEDVDRALDDMGTALELFALSTRKAYFVEAIALIACFLEHSAERRHFEVALAHLKRFLGRLHGLRHLSEVRDRLRWVTGQIESCLGRHRAARPLLERARKNTAKHSPHRYALAIGLDEARLYCRIRPETWTPSIRRILLWCARTLKLEPEHGEGLARAIAEIEEEPYHAGSILWKFRRSYVVPVPALVGRPWPPILGEDEDEG